MLTKTVKFVKNEVDALESHYLIEVRVLWFIVIKKIKVHADPVITDFKTILAFIK